MPKHIKFNTDVTFQGNVKIDEHNVLTDENVTENQQELVNSIESGALWIPGQTGSVTVTGDDLTGVAISSSDGMGRVEVKKSGVVMTSKRTPQWLDAENPAFYNIRTTKDLTATDASISTSVNNLSGRIDTLSGNVQTVQAALN